MSYNFSSRLKHHNFHVQHKVNIMERSREIVKPAEKCRPPPRGVYKSRYKLCRRLETWLKARWYHLATTITRKWEGRIFYIVFCIFNFFSNQLCLRSVNPNIWIFATPPPWLLTLASPLSDIVKAGQSLLWTLPLPYIGN